MMVEKFGYSVSEVSALYLFNYVFNLLYDSESAPG